MQNFRKEGLSPLESVKGAVASRLRPVLMTTSTTLMGLSPLVFLPGAGTELYRGLGAIVLFGLAFTAFVTLTFLPCLLVTLLEVSNRLRGLRTQDRETIT
jgi:multidrug efflux pump subunit AcrB